MRNSVVRCIAFAALLLASTVYGDVNPVTNTTDGSAGSLREVIAAAMPGDTIVFQIPTSDPGYDPATGVHTISLTSAGLTIAKNLTIRGNGANIVVQRSTAAGTPLFGIFNITAGDVTLTRLTIRGGRAGSPPGTGAGIRNAAGLTLNDCTLEDNRALLHGGAIANQSGATLVMNECMVSRCGVEGRGGAVYNEGFTFVATNSTFSDNFAEEGGAIYNGPSSSVSVINCTITGNRNAGIHNVGISDVANTIIAGNIAPIGEPGDVSGSFASDGHNLIGRVEGSAGFTNGVNNDQVGTNAAPLDPRLGPLQNNGGPTQTHALLSDSSAINTGNDGRARPYDQRSFSRVGVRDIGSFELGGLQTVLANISTRGRVETEDNALIGGFIVTGSEPKTLIARAIGPSLSVAGALANPYLEIIDAAGGVVAANDDWRLSPRRDEIIASTIAPTHDLESAIIGSVDPGAYTAIVRGSSGGTGVGLVEVYDVQRAADSRLANISTRGLVQGGDDVMIGGFIVVGGRPQYTIIRALGPSLPLADRLADPSLELYNSNGVSIAANDNWSDDQRDDIIATGIPPSREREAAVVGTAPAGAYTAVVRGVGGATGTALVEVYKLDF